MKSFGNGACLVAGVGALVAHAGNDGINLFSGIRITEQELEICAAMKRRVKCTYVVESFIQIFVGVENQRNPAYNHRNFIFRESLFHPWENIRRESFVTLHRCENLLENPEIGFGFLFVPVIILKLWDGLFTVNRIS